jgi:hypothetical protein
MLHSAGSRRAYVQVDYRWMMANAEEEAVKVLAQRMKSPATIQATKDKDA